MNSNLSNSLIKTMKEWVELHLGHKITDSRMDDFEKRLLLASAESGYSNPNEFIASIIRGKDNQLSINLIALYLTIGETYFFRDPMSYTVLKTKVLPDLLNTKRKGEKISIWSAGCSSGEEPYSLAMTLLSEIKPEHPVQTTILATDINENSLKIARRAVYRRWSFRDIPAFIQDKYFSASDEESYNLKSEVKNLVNFSHLNLAQDTYPSILNGTDNLDVIFCRNVLIYFSPEQVTSTLIKFHKCLRTGGWLFLAPSEIPHPVPDFFSVQNINGAIVLKKENRTKTAPNNPIRIIKSNYSYFGSTTQNFGKSIDSLIESPREMDITVQDSSKKTEDSLELELDEENLDLDVLNSKIEELFSQGEYRKIINAVPQLPSPGEVASKETMVLIAKAYANTGNLEAAVDWCERLISQDTINPRWYYLKATIHHERGEEEAAIKSLRQAIFLDENYVIAHFVMGNLHRQQGNEAKSDKCFDHVSKLLAGRDKADVIMDSDGLTVGQLKSIVSSLGGDKTNV